MPQRPQKQPLGGLEVIYRLRQAQAHQPESAACKPEGQVTQLKHLDNTET